MLILVSDKHWRIANLSWKSYDPGQKRQRLHPDNNVLAHV